MHVYYCAASGSKLKEIRCLELLNNCHTRPLKQLFNNMKIEANTIQ